MAKIYVDDGYEKNEFTQAVEKHLKEYPEYPIHIKLGDSKNISLNTNSLIALNEVFAKYQDRLYDSDKLDLNFHKNPNIALVTNKTLQLDNNKSKVNLNSILVTSVLNTLADCKQTFTNNPDITRLLLVFKKNDSTTSNSRHSIADIELFPHTPDNIKKLQKDGYTMLNAEHPLTNTTSTAEQYYSVINALVGKPVLNPHLKYTYNQEYDVFKKLPKEYKTFERLFKGTRNPATEKLDIPQPVKNNNSVTPKRKTGRKM